ncbi:MAG: TolC family protein, partial [Polyangiaceae bacterium]
MIRIPFTRRRLRVRPARVESFLALLIPLSGCATTAGGSTYQSQPRAFEQTRSAGSTPPSGPADAAVRAPVLGRSSFVRAVLRSNPTIEAARQGWRGALARVGQSGGFDDPMLDVGVAPLSVGSSRAAFGYEVGISQKLPWFGKRSLEASVTAAEAEASKSDYEAVRRELALSALSLFDQYFVAVRSLEVNAHHVELMRSMRDGAAAQFGAGRGSAQDALQAESELAHMEHDSAVLASQRDVIGAQMNELMHRPPEAPLPPPPRELPLPPDLDADTKQLEAQALRGRPEIAAARYHAQAEQARADRADRESYPDLTLSTTYNSMWDMPEHRWMVGVGLNLPIQTGRRAALRDEALAARAQFESQAVRMSDAARTRVFVALKQLEESKHIIQLFQQRLMPLARDQVDAARAGFVASQNPFTALVDAEKNSRSVELDYQRARADYDRRWAELEHALGRIP